MNHTTALNTGKSFYLVIGRKRQLITKPARFEANQEIATMYRDHAELTPSLMLPVSQTYQLFIDNDLFATVKAAPKWRYRRAPIHIVKPKQGPIEIRFVKKYVILH